MFAFYAFLCAFCLCLFDLFYFKIFQLEGYKVKNYIKKIFKINIFKFDKNKINFTKRIKRLIFFDFFIKFCLFLILFSQFYDFFVICFVFFTVFLFSSIFVIFSFLAVEPIEIFIKYSFIKKAKTRLGQVGCKVIAITGSFGKTSVKNILFDILSEQFQVCKTPKSFNTPMGICKTILENLKDFDEYLIVEYGARRKGDIDFLAKNFGADFALLTPIGNCHLETFGNIKNIEDAKFELCAHTKEVAVFNGKSNQTKNLFNKYMADKVLVCEEGSFCFAKNIRVCNVGSEFVLCVDGKEISCQTRLLGRCNIDNIVQASAMAYILGESLFNIQKAIKNIKSIPHRLELIKGQGVKIIDDSYNSNLNGFKQALEVLSGFQGQKVIVSPGMIELGDQQYQTNYCIGEEIAKIADIFILMNETNKKALFEGAINGGLNKNNIYFASSRNEQKILLKNLLKKDAVVLFENDLPDNYK